MRRAHGSLVCNTAALETLRSGLYLHCLKVLHSEVHSESHHVGSPRSQAKRLRHREVASFFNIVGGFFTIWATREAGLIFQRSSNPGLLCGSWHLLSTLMVIVNMSVTPISGALTALALTSSWSRSSSSPTSARFPGFQPASWTSFFSESVGYPVCILEDCYLKSHVLGAMGCDSWILTHRK